MADEEVLKKLEARLTRLEAGLAQSATAAGSFRAPGGAVVDPAPWGGGNPVVDPAPWPGPWGGVPPWYRPWWPIPNPVVDPAPWGGFAARNPAFTIGNVGPIGDPPPFDVSRLSIAQLESSLHNIAAEKTRLDATEKLVKQQIKALKQPG